MDALDPDPDLRYGALAELRAKCPVHSLGTSDRYMAVDHESVATGLRSVNDIGGSAGQRGLAEDDTMISGILEPRHGEVRRIVNSVVAFHKSQQIEPYLEALCVEHIGEVLRIGAAGPVEIMSSYVEPLPPAAMARLLGFPEGDAAQFFGWGAQAGAAFGRAAVEGRSISLREACPEMAAYVDARIAERRAAPGESWPNDALTRFLTTDVEGEHLSDRAVSTQIMFAIGAGSDTTRNVLGSMFYRLALDPDLYAQVREDRALVEPVFEEALRIDAPAQFMVRQCLSPTFNLGGTELHEGDTVMLSIASANRDESVFPDPDTFDPLRGNLREHLGFGTGPHICPGSALARLELRLALDTWCDNIERFELAPGYRWTPPQTGMLHGPQTLSVLITPVERP